ncbi:MAG TPA: hypothetical protein VIN08_03175 [Ohtaekwangia sp.]|uniref:hypothetical protein n=1 Tax=Ohtaekwangia sp. TaxID=2066019 RepID=UPI002F94DE7B
MKQEVLHTIVYLCGLGHIALSAGSLAIPKLLQWSTHLKNIPLLLRQMFWTYAGYILVINFSFGVISIIGTDELLDHSFLAKYITLFIGLYWLARVIIQFFYFDRTNAPKGLLYTLGEAALVLLFILFTIVYLTAFLYNIAWI